MLISSTCNECGAEVLVDRESDNYLFGRIYCEAHSVLRPQWRTCPAYGQPQPACVTSGSAPHFVTGVNHVCGR